MNPGERWNPGWPQFMMNQQQRAMAGGNRQVQPIQQPIRQPAVERNNQPRRNNAPAAQNRRNHQHRHNNVNNNNQNAVGGRRDQRVNNREILTRDDLERIEAMNRRNFQTRTALEYDNREDLCWMNIQNSIEKDSRQFSSSFNGGDVMIPHEDNICSNLRIENQKEIIMTARELLLNSSGTEQDLTDALANLDVHLRTNALEYNCIEDLSNELIKNAGKLAREMDELDGILNGIERIRLNQK